MPNGKNKRSRGRQFQYSKNRINSHKDYIIANENVSTGQNKWNFNSAPVHF